MVIFRMSNSLRGLAFMKKGIYLTFLFLLSINLTFSSSGDVPHDQLSVKVFTDKHISEINERIFGIHLPAWNETLVSQGIFNSRIANNMKDAGICYLVYPGGNFGYDFVWNNLHSKNELSSDDLLNIAEDIGAYIKISLNPNESPSLAAQWIRYLNFELNADVKYWEVADEPYLTMNVDQFIDKMKTFVPVMKEVDPSIKIVANVSVDNENYTKKVIREIGDLIDVYSIHFFPLPPSKAVYSNSPYDKNNKDSFYADLLNSTQKLPKQIATLRQWVEEVYPYKDIEYQIGSFAPVWWGPEDWTVNSLPAGLWVADMLGIFAKENLSGAAFWALMNPYPPQQGDFGMFSPNMQPYVSFYPYVLFNKHFGKILVENTCNRQDLSIYTSLSKNEKNLYIMIINKSANKSFNINFDLGTFVPREDGAAWILDGPVNIGNPTDYGLRKEGLNNIHSIFEYSAKPYSIIVLEIPGKDSNLDITESPNLALNKSACASSIALNTDSKYYTTYDYIPDMAIDGDPNTRWASKIFKKDIESFTLDLGQEIAFNQIVIEWEYWATRYAIEVSKDDNNWEKIADQENALKEKDPPQPVDVINLDNIINARYIRISMFERPKDSGAKAGCSQWTPDAFSIWELGVFLR